MKKYKVIPLAVSGHSNKVFKSGDIVTASDFVEGNVSDLIKQGFLLPLDEEKNESPDVDSNEPEAAEEVTKATEETSKKHTRKK